MQKFLLRRTALLLFLCFSLVLYGKAQTTINFSDIESTNGLVGTTGNPYTYTYSHTDGNWKFTGQDVDGDLNPGSFSSYSGHGLLFHDGAGTSGEVVTMETTDGRDVNMTNLVLEELVFYQQLNVTIEGYKDGGWVNSATALVPAGSSVSVNLGWTVDKIIISTTEEPFGFSLLTIGLDSFTFNAANTAPTASSFSTDIYQGIPHIVKTADFGYMDADGDPLDHIYVYDDFAAPTLYVDKNNNDAYDYGEMVSSGDKVSKADLDAGNLQVISSHVWNDSFYYYVNDGTDNSLLSRYSIRTIPIPTVTLGINPSGNSESVTTANAITASLSNAYGVNTTVNLSFGGTATGGGIDYSVSGTSIVIPAGSTTGTNTLTNTSDALYENDETVIIDIVSVTNGVESGTQQQTYTINDDDSQPNASLLLRDIYNPITDESGGQAYIVAQLNAVAGTSVSVPISFSGTATGGGTDYSITGSTITLSPGETMDSIRVTSLFDGIEEGDETVIIDMGTPTNATENGTQQVTLTIQDEDATNPLVSISSTESDPTNNTAIPLNFTFSESVTGFTSGNVTASNGSIANFSGSGATYTAELIPENDGTVTVDIAGSVATDDFGNANTAASQFSIRYDGSAPTVSISSTVSDPTNGSFTVNFQFNEDVTGFDISDVNIANANKTNFQATDARNYSVELTPVADGTVTVEVAANAATDAVGNGNAVATQFSITYDVTSPDLTITATESSPTNANPIPIRIEFNEIVTGFQASDITISNATLQNFKKIEEETFAYKFGSSGSAAGQFVGIVEVAVGQNNIYVADRDNHRILVFDLTGAFIRQFGSSGTGNGQFDGPHGLAIDAEGKVYVADSDNHRIQVFDPDGTYLRQFGSYGSGDGQFFHPKKLAIDNDNNVYVADHLNYRIQVFDPNGTYLRQFGSQGTGDGQFNSPIGVAVDAHGNVYVADGNNDNIQVFDPSGTYLYKFGSLGAGNGQFDTPVDVAVNANGIIYVADGSNNRIQVFNQTGNYLRQFGKTGSEDGEFSVPYGLTVDAAGSIFVADYVNDRVQVFTYESYYTAELDPEAEGTMTVDINAGVATDEAGNDNTAATQFSITYDGTAPAGYTVAFDQADINPGNWSNASFTFAGAEADATYAYSISSSGDGNTATITGNGTITTANQQISGIDVSSLTNGTLTLFATLTDPVGNIGSAASANIAKDKYSQSITFNALADKTYGDADFTLGASASSGLTVSYESSDPTIASISGSTVSILKAGSVTITAQQAGNAEYNAASDASQSLTISKAMLTVTADDKTKVYGEANPVFTVSYSGFAGSDDASVLATAPQASVEGSTSAVGTYQIDVSGGVDTNYDFNYVTGTLTVSKATLTVTASNQSKTYGESNPTLSFTYSGFVGRDNASSLDTEPIVTTEANAGSSVGNYAITASGGADNNYDFTYVDGTLTISQAMLTVTANDKTKAYGETNPALTVSYSGFVNGDSEADLATAPTAATSADATSAVGSYAITASGGVDVNYAFTYVDGSLTISKAMLTATADDQSKVYGEANPALTVSYSGFMNGDAEADLATAPAASTSADATSPVGTYDISVSGGADENYDFSYVDGTLRITKPVLTVTADNKSKVYGEANPTLTFTYSGFVNGDTEADLTTVPTAATTADPTSAAGSYAIKVSGGVDANYNFTYVDGSLTVSQAMLTVTVEDQSKVYGEANPALTVSYSGFMNGDTQAELATAPVAATTAYATSAVGSYAITAAGGVDENYSFTYVDGTLTISKAMLTVTAEDQSKVYGEANPALTVSYSGFVNGDSETDLTTVPTAATTADATSAVGSYTITVSGGADANYTFTYEEGSLSVTKAMLTVTANDQQRTYFEANPALTFSYNGFVNGDTEAELAEAPIATTQADANAPAGTYAIVLAGGSDENYAFTYVGGTLTITNNAPAFNSTAVTSVLEDAVYQYAISTEDADNGDVLIIAANNLPAWLSLTDKGNGTAMLEGTPTNEHVGQYTISLRVTDLAGDVNTQEFKLEVINTNDAPHALSLDNNSLAENQPAGTFIGTISSEDVDLLNNASETASYSLVAGESDTDNVLFYVEGDGLYAVQPLNYDEKAVYSIRLAVTDAAGASYSEAFSINLTDEQDQRAFLPNLFSPNGDGNNDAFILRAFNIEALSLRIFNKQGVLVFETSDVTEATEQGWNGQANGNPQPSGTYVWQLDGRYSDGSPLTIDGKKIGNITLIR